jgi:hypothetical protein
MMEAEQRTAKRRKRPMAGSLGALTLAIAVGVLSTGCGAAELLGPARPTGLPPLLASVTILSDAAMANEKGTGLQAPAILNDPAGHARVLLWDELRAPPQLAPATEPTINIGK